MKLITPFTILNQNFHEMDLIKNEMSRRKLATEKLHNDYRKIYKINHFAYLLLMEFLKRLWLNQPNTVIGLGVTTFVLL